MPIFEYKCTKCGRKAEFLENPGSRAAKSCPHCGSRKLDKQISVFAAKIKEGGSKRCYGCSDNHCPHARH